MEEYECNLCHRQLICGMNFCPHCGAPLRWYVVAYPQHEGPKLVGVSSCCTTERCLTEASWVAIKE